MGVVVAAQGDSVVSLAAAHGFHPRTLWEHEQNAGLRSEERSVAVLHPGDEVFVPELVVREEGCGTEARHRFVRKGVPSMFKMRFLFAGEPRKGLAFSTKLDGVHGPSGRLDDEGYVEFGIGPTVTRVEMVLEGEAGQEEYAFAVGHLDPVTRVSGVKHRLNSLGYACGEENEQMTEELRGALTAFQVAQGLEGTGEADDATREKLKSVYEAAARS